MDNKFDFNKLFKEGISYQRLSDVDLVKRRIARKFNEAPQFNRMYTHLGTQSKRTLEEYLAKVQNFVELSKRSPD